MGFGGKGKGGDDWMWQMMSMMMGGGKGKGGKLAFSNNPAKRVPPPRKVFIGGFPELGSENLSTELNKKLQEHCNQAGKCTYAEVGRKGSGVACFSTDAEAETAVAMLNGSVFEGNVLEVGAWAKKKYNEDGAGKGW